MTTGGMIAQRTANCVLTINGGSSSIKFALFEAGGALRRVLAGRIEGIGLPKGSFAVKGANEGETFRGKWSRRITPAR